MVSITKKIQGPNLCSQKCNSYTKPKTNFIKNQEHSIHPHWCMLCSLLHAATLCGKQFCSVAMQTLESYVGHRVTRLGDFSPIRLLFVGSLKEQPKNGNTWDTNLLHFHLKKLFKKGFVIRHYFVWQLFWLLFKTLGDFFPNHLVTLVGHQCCMLHVITYTPYTTCHKHIFMKLPKLLQV